MSPFFYFMTMKIAFGSLLLSLLLMACSSSKRLYVIPSNQDNEVRLTGTQFIQKVKDLTARQQDSLIVPQILQGNVPSFLHSFTQIKTTILGKNGKKIKAFYYVSPDYLAIGTNTNWVRMPMTPQAAQLIADSLRCFLPTRKISDDVFKAAKVKLQPQPLTQNRESPLTFLEHNQLIENQRKGRKGLIAGIKKDVILSSQINKYPKPNRVAIYGWHYPEGKPIQPLYVGHIDWYVDYSHGIRLIYEKVWVNGKPILYTEILKDSTLRALICDEDNCSFERYRY